MNRDIGPQEENFDGHTLVTKQEGELVKNDVEDGTQTSKVSAPIQSADKQVSIGVMILQI